MSGAQPVSVLVFLAPPLVGAVVGLAMGLLASKLILSRRALQHAVKRIIITPRFLHGTRQEIARNVSLLFALPLKDVASRTGAARILADQILPLLARRENRAALVEAAGKAARAQGPALVTDDLVQSLSNPLARQLPVVVERVIEWMESEPMRETIAARGRELLPRILDQLNVMQRFLLSAGQFDKRLDEKMPEIVEETLQALERIMRDPAQQHALRDRILLAIRDWRDGQTAGEDLSLALTQVLDGFLESFGKPETQLGARNGLEASLSAGGLSLGAFLGRYAGLEETRVSDSLANAVLGWISRPQTPASISERLGSGGGLLSLARGRLVKAAAIFGLSLGLAIGLVQDISFLLWH